MVLLVHEVEQIAGVKYPMHPIHPSITEQNIEYKLCKFIPPRYPSRPKIVKFGIAADLSYKDRNGWNDRLGDGK